MPGNTGDQEFWARLRKGLERVRSYREQMLHNNPRYRDQARASSRGDWGRSYFIALTPFGIADLDTSFCHRIQNLATEDEADGIESDIRRNPHLHQEIKDNLLLNLGNYRKHLVEENP